MAIARGRVIGDPEGRIRELLVQPSTQKVVE
jgi:hypothetical protein